MVGLKRKGDAGMEDGQRQRRTEVTIDKVK